MTTCSSTSPTGTVSGALSACQPPCVYAVLDCNNAPAWELHDTSLCNPEDALFSSLICEVTDIAGWDVEVRVLLTNDDKLFGEDANARLTPPARTKAAFEPSEESSILNMWGLSWNDTMQFIVIPKSMYTRDMRDLYRSTPELVGKPIQPKVGDIIRTVFNDRSYEVTDVGSESVIINAKKFVWELIVKPFRFSEQSESHREVYRGEDIEDPFEFTDTLTQDPTGGIVPQNNFARDTYGDNDFVEEKSEQIDDYRDVVDPDRASFGY